MDERDRQSIGRKRIYSNNKILEASRLQVWHVPKSHSTFQTTGKNNKIHYIVWNKKNREWQCDCWWFANRSNNRERHGYCKHVLGVLYKFAPEKFEEEAKREVEIKC